MVLQAMILDPKIYNVHRPYGHSLNSVERQNQMRCMHDVLVLAYEISGVTRLKLKSSLQHAENLQSRLVGQFPGNTK